MALKATLESLEGLDDTMKVLYKPHDGKFRIDVEGVEFAEDVAALKNAFARTKEEASTAKAALKSFDGLDAEAAREALAKVEEFSKIDPAKEADKLAQQRVDAWVAKESKKYQAEIETREARVKSLKAALESSLIDTAAMEAITSEKGRAKALLPHVKSAVRVREVDGKYVVEVLDASGNPRIGDAQGNPMTIRQFVAELKTDPDFQPLFEGTNQGGSGAGGSGAAGGAGGAPARYSEEQIKAMPLDEFARLRREGKLI